MDYITYDKYIDHGLQFFNPADIPLRKSQDRITDYNGLKLLDMCISTGLLIGLIWKVQFFKRVRFRHSFLCHLKVHNKSEKS